MLRMVVSDDEQHIPDDAQHTPPESLHHIPDDELLKRKVVVNITSRDQFYEQVYLVKRCLQKAGHGCYNVFEHYWGEPRLGFCWPQPKASIAEPNPHYQCCRHGKAAVVDVGEGRTTKL